MATPITGDSTTESRHKRALVIGISEYQDGQCLPNATNDANEMCSALKRIGFQVIGDKAQLNLTYKQMDQAVAELKHAIQKGDIVVFYFAGHGKQWEVCKINAYKTKWLII